MTLRTHCPYTHAILCAIIYCASTVTVNGFEFNTRVQSFQSAQFDFNFDPVTSSASALLSFKDHKANHNANKRNSVFPAKKYEESKMAYDHGNQPIFSFLLTAEWYNATSLQELFQRMKQDIFNRNSFNAAAIMDYQRRCWRSTLEGCCRGTVPFKLEMRFEEYVVSSGWGRAKGLYICESVGGWAPLLNQFWFSLRKKVKLEDADRELEALISIMSRMEEKMGKMEGVFNRQIFEEQFKFQWVDPSNVTACSK